MSQTAKALANVNSYTRRWADRMAKRTNRIYDDRDQALADAMLILEARSDSYYPAVTDLDAALSALDTGDKLTGLVITGTNLVGDMETAEGETENSSGTLSFDAILPGEQTITLTITDDGSALAVDSADASAGTIAVVLGDGGGAGAGGAYTAAEVKAVLDAHAVAKYMVATTIDTAGDMDADETVTIEITSADPGTLPVLQIGTDDIDGSADNGVTAWADTSITFDYDPTGLVNGETVFLRLWVDDVLVLNTPLVAGGAFFAPALAAAAGTGVEASTEEFSVKKLTLNLANVDIPLADEAGVIAHGGLKIADMPEGAVVFIGAVTDLAITKDSAGVDDDWNGDFSLGTAEAGNDAALNGTEADIIPSTVTPVAAAGATTADGQSTATECPAYLDGTTTAVDVWLNFLVDDADHNVGATPCNLIANGTVEITYGVLGDN